jgi:hypothetical protein
MGKEIQKDNKKDNGDNFWNFLTAIAFVLGKLLSHPLKFKLKGLIKHLSKS